jgi:hypothetical protein
MRMLQIGSLWIFPSRSLNALPSLDCFLVFIHVQNCRPIFVAVQKNNICVELVPAIVSDTSLFINWLCRSKIFTVSLKGDYSIGYSVLVKVSSTWFSSTPSKHAFEGHLLQGQNMLSLTIRVLFLGCKIRRD